MKANNTPATMNAKGINAKQSATKAITVKRSEWNETAKRLECSGWYYIGTPTATGKTIYRRGNSEVEIIIEEDSPATKFSELYHAGQCLDIYLHNTREIYDRYTVPAIRKVAAMMRSNATHPQQFDVSPAGVSGLWEVIRAISAAAGLVRKYDELAPTQDDKNQVIRNYAAYIVDCAKYEIENA